MLRINRFIVPGFLGGMAQALDLGGGGGFQLDRSGLSPAQRDARALAGDWAMVGTDLHAAVRRVRAEARNARGGAGHGAR